MAGNDDIDIIIDKNFRKRLKAAAAAIKKDANGKTCGECKYMRPSWCAEEKNIEGQPLSILYHTAPACHSFTPKMR